MRSYQVKLGRLLGLLCEVFSTIVLSVASLRYNTQPEQDVTAL
jgi:hypothetical protein